MMGLRQGQLRRTIKNVVYRLDALHERMILIGHFVFPGTKPAARPYLDGTQRRLDGGEMGVATQPGRRITMFNTVTPTGHDIVGWFQELRAYGTRHDLINQARLIDGLRGGLRDFEHQ